MAVGADVPGGGMVVSSEFASEQAVASPLIPMIRWVIRTWSVEGRPCWRAVPGLYCKKLLINCCASKLTRCWV